MARQTEISTDSLPAASSDTLPSAGIKDSLPNDPFLSNRDSLFLDTDSLYTTPPPPVKAEEVFGTTATIVHNPDITQPRIQINESGLFQSVVLALTLIYLFVICRNIRETYDLLRKLTLDPAKAGRMAEIQGSSNTRFLWAMTVIGFPMLALFLLRVADQKFSLPTLVPLQWIPASGVLIVIVIAAVALYQIGFLWLTGRITLSQTTTEQLTNLKFNYFALGSVLLCPLALLYLLTPDQTGLGVLYCTWIGLGIILLLYLKDTLSLFLSKKIPILHWILYLCVVEVFPLSLIGFWAASI